MFAMRNTDKECAVLGLALASLGLRSIRCYFGDHVTWPSVRQARQCCLALRMTRKTVWLRRAVPISWIDIKSPSAWVKLAVKLVMQVVTRVACFMQLR